MPTSSEFGEIYLKKQLDNAVARTAKVQTILAQYPSLGAFDQEQALISAANEIEAAKAACLCAAQMRSRLIIERQEVK